MLRAQAAYGHDARAIRTPKGTEYDAFARITGKLKSAARPGAGMPELAAALHENRRLWILMAADVADRANGLPADLRARILYLAEFTQIHSRKVLAGKVSADALVDINLAVMRGLRDRSGTA